MRKKNKVPGTGKRSNGEKPLPQKKSAKMIKALEDQLRKAHLVIKSLETKEAKRSVAEELKKKHEQEAKDLMAAAALQATQYSYDLEKEIEFLYGEVKRSMEKNGQKPGDKFWVGEVRMGVNEFMSVSHMLMFESPEPICSDVSSSALLRALDERIEFLKSIPGATIPKPPESLVKLQNYLKKKDQEAIF